MLKIIFYILISVAIAYLIFQYTLSNRISDEKIKWAVIAGIAANLLLVIIAFNT